MNIIIDGDIIAFMAASKYKTDMVKAIARSDELIDEVRMAGFQDPDSVHVYVKGQGNFRDQEPTYKAKRHTSASKSPRPETLEPVREHLAYEYGEHAHGGEADDYCVMAAYQYRKAGEPYIIATIDKDLRQMPGLFYNLWTNEMSHVTPMEGYNWLLTQCLTGDSTDGIEGIKGIGPKKAAKILQENPDEPEQAILQTYIDKFGPGEGVERLSLCFNLVYMRRVKDALRFLPLPEVFFYGRRNSDLGFGYHG